MGVRLFTGLVLAIIMVAAPALAQNDNGRRILDRAFQQFEEVIRQIEEVETDDAEPEGEAQIIDFEAIRTRDGRAPVTLTNQYERSHGVRFGRGVSVHRCAGAYDEFSSSLCPYPRAASGDRAAMFDVEIGGQAMVLDFVEPADAVSLRINPTGGGQGVRYQAQAVGLDAQGEVIAAAREAVAFSDNNLNWPHVLALKGDRPIVRVQIAMIVEGASFAAARVNNQPVRFFIDDLAIFRLEPLPTVPPIAAALSEQDGPPRVGRAVIVQSPSVGSAQSGLRLYPAAVRKRLAIDWDAVDAALAEQNAMNLVAVSPSGDGQKYIDLAALPLLLPQSADAGSLKVFGGADVVNAVWRAGGRDYSVYGSRMATVIRKADGASGVRSAITFSGSEDELTASFSLFGASYALSQHCNGGATADPGCFDRDALGKIAEDLVVVVGDTGRARP